MQREADPLIAQPANRLENDLKAYFNALGSIVLGEIIYRLKLIQGGIIIEEEKVREAIKEEKLVKKDMPKLILGAYLGLYALKLGGLYKSKLKTLVKDKNKLVIGSVPIVIDEITPNKKGVTSFSKKWDKSLSKASLDFQRALLKDASLYIKDNKDKDIFLKKTKDYLSKRISKKKFSSFLEEELNFSKKKAKFWAQDLRGTYYAQTTKAIYKAGNIKKYIWLTVGDSKVRPEHVSLNKKIRTMNEGVFPGEAPACRCVSSPYFGEDKKK